MSDRRYMVIDFDRPQSIGSVYNDAQKAVEVSRRSARAMGEPERNVYTVDVDEVERFFPPESHDEAAERHERLWQHHFAAYLQLTGREPSERREVEVREEDLEFHAWPSNRYGGQQVGVSTGVIIHHKPTGIAAVCNSERSQLANRKRALEKLRAAVGEVQGKEQGLTAEERYALRGFNSRIKAGEATATPNEWNLIVAALDKLLALQGER